MPKVYVASSWRNKKQPQVVKALRNVGFEVYDFHNPGPGDNGFQWSEVDPDWQGWNAEQFREGLDHPIAINGFRNDINALRDCDCCVLVNPCGRSAHLEAGFACGYGKPTFILLQDGDEPELMYLMADMICTNLDELIREMVRLYLLELPVACSPGERNAQC
jgi:nucleoside 2-deoxyribosyltransferase